MRDIVYMSNDEVVRALQEIKTYTNRNSIEAIAYAIEIFQRFEEAGIKVPMEVDFKKLASALERK